MTSSLPDCETGGNAHPNEKERKKHELRECFSRERSVHPAYPFESSLAFGASECSKQENCPLVHQAPAAAGSGGSNVRISVPQLFDGRPGTQVSQGFCCCRCPWRLCPSLYLFVFILLVPLLCLVAPLVFSCSIISSCSVSFALCTSSTPVLPSILGPRLGLTIQNCWVSSISNPLAAQYGWQAGASGFLQNPSVYAESTAVFALCFLIDKFDRIRVCIPCTCSRMQVGDHILQVNGHPVSNMQQLSEEIRSAK